MTISRDGYPPIAEGFGVYNEWGTLREVFVGGIDHTRLPEYDPAIDVSGPEVTQLLKDHPGELLSDAWPEKFEQGRKGLQNLADAYEAAGVTVHRLRAPNDDEQTHLAYQMGGVFQVFPADPTWTIGRHYVEMQCRQPIIRRNRFQMRDLFRDRVGQNPDARWVASPVAAPTRDTVHGAGPYLDGGDVLILGDQVLVGVDLDHFSTDQAGAEWLQRYLADDGITVTIVPFRNAVKIHLLAHLGVPREGLAIIYKPLFEEFGIPEPLKDYEFIEITEDEAAQGAACIVALDSTRTLLPAECGRVADELSAKGIEPVTVEFSEPAWWGGAIRCATNIVWREVDG